MHEDVWRESLTAWLLDHARELGLDPAPLQLEHLVNPSGWHRNVACTVTDGSKALHVKLSPDRQKLRTTFQLRETLSARYRAPHVLAWIDLGDLVGLVMPSIRGRPGNEALIPQLVQLSDALHEDGELADALTGEQPASVGEAFRDVWIERFESDLDELEAGQKMPPFVDAATVAWMRRETALLRVRTEAPVFALPPSGSVHGDLHLGNVLAADDGGWWLVDWDDLHRGDPAMDLAMLLAPMIVRGEPAEGSLGWRDRDFEERFAVCERAVVLDQVIDPLADWAEADSAPHGADELRKRMRRAHERGLATYRARYG